MANFAPIFKIRNRSTQKVTNNYKSVKIFKTVCNRRLRGRVFIPYCLSPSKIFSNTAAMVARGVDMTGSTTTELTTNPETFTETTKSGLEMSKDTDMIIDDHEKRKKVLIF